MNAKPKTRILFVCMGNICRSPTAQGVFEHELEKRGLADRLHVDSAGTHAYHVGEPPDARSQAAALSRGVDLSAQRARAVSDDDFETYDLVIAMDADNLAALRERSPQPYADRLYRMLDFAQDATVSNVPDPYYGDGAGFERVLDLTWIASVGLVEWLAARGRL